MSEKTPALAATPHPLGRPGGPGLFHDKALQLPPYVQNIAHALMRQQGMTKSRAIQIALGKVEDWKDGKGNVSAEVRAASAAAWAQWLAARATAKAKPNKSDHSSDADAVELAQARVPSGNAGAGQWYGEPDYSTGPRTRAVPTVNADNLQSTTSSTRNTMSKAAKTFPPGKGSVEDRLHRKLVARGIHPKVARRMAKRAAARVIRERITGPGTPAAAALSRSGGNVVELAEIHQWKHGWIPLTPYAVAIKAKMAHGSTRGKGPDLPKSLHSKAAELHAKHGKTVVHGSYGHSEIPAGHASRKELPKQRQEPDHLDHAVNRVAGAGGENLRQAVRTYTDPRAPQADRASAHRIIEEHGDAALTDRAAVLKHARIGSPRKFDHAGFTRELHRVESGDQTHPLVAMRNGNHVRVKGIDHEYQRGGTTHYSGRVTSVTPTVVGKGKDRRPSWLTNVEYQTFIAHSVSQGRNADYGVRADVPSHARVHVHGTEPKVQPVSDPSVARRAKVQTHVDELNASARERLSQTADREAKAAEVTPKKVTPESKRAAERKTLTKDERKAYNDAAAASKAKYQPAQRQHDIGMAAAKEHTAAKQREADIAHYTPEQRAIYDRETGSRYRSSHHQAMRTVDVLMKERAAAQEKKAAEDAKQAKDLADFKAGLGSMSTEELRNAAKTRSSIWPGVDDRKAKLAGAELQRRASARTAERLMAKPEQVIGGAGLHRIHGAPHQYLVKQDGKALGIVTGHSKNDRGELKPTFIDDKPTHYIATTVGRRKPGSDTSTMPRKNSTHESLADAVGAVQTRGGKIPKESKADQASLFDVPKTGRSTKAPAMGEGEVGGPIKFAGGRTGTVWADAPEGGKWVIPDERQPGEAHAIYVSKDGKVHEELSSAARQKDWMQRFRGSTRTLNALDRAALAEPKSRASERKLPSAEAKVGDVSPEEERAALSDAQRRVYDITRNQILAHGPSLPNKQSVHNRAMQAAKNDRLIADYERGRAHMQQQQADRERAAFRRSKSVSAMRKAAQARQSAASAATGSAKLSKVSDSDLLSSLQAMRSGPDFGGRDKVIAELEAEIRRRGLKAPANLSSTGGTVIELAKIPARLRAAARQEAADNDTALPDGSWPIRNRAELAAAIQSWGRAVASGRSSTVKAWILKRAKALGASQDVIARIQALEAA